MITVATVMAQAIVPRSLRILEAERDSFKRELQAQVRLILGWTTPSCMKGTIPAKLQQGSFNRG
jgi:hypothetical protein